MARESSQSNGRLKYLAPDAVRLGEMHPVADHSWIERAGSALIDLGWLPPEGRDWAAGLMRRHADGQR